MSHLVIHIVIDQREKTGRSTEARHLKRGRKSEVILTFGRIIALLVHVDKESEYFLLSNHSMIYCIDDLKFDFISRLKFWVSFCSVMLLSFLIMIDGRRDFYIASFGESNRYVHEGLLEFIALIY